MPLSPEVLQRITMETVEKDVAAYEKGVKDTLESGWAIWSLSPPQKRLAGYMACTWPEDLPLILDNPDYIDLFKAGVMPPLRAMLEWEAITAPQPDGKGGMVIPQPSDFRPYYWALLSICPPYVFKRDADDFRALLRDAGRKA